MTWQKLLKHPNHYLHTHPFWSSYTVRQKCNQSVTQCRWVFVLDMYAWILLCRSSHHTGFDETCKDIPTYIQDIAETPAYRSNTSSLYNIAIISQLTSSVCNMLSSFRQHETQLINITITSLCNNSVVNKKKTRISLETSHGHCITWNHCKSSFPVIPVWEVLRDFIHLFVPSLLCHSTL